MSGGEEQPECPLCMEPLEIDDVSFYPCTCGYQICRFCWHRIRTNENGLCPACRKAYPEDPAEFKPLTDDEIHRIKKDRRQKESQRKQKSAESRKHLANVRVVQKNLVFVVGLASRLCDAETLRRHEYFGKFGKIHKVVINQSTSYVGSQGPSASAYVTYFRPEDAIAAIRAVNNLQVDGRTLKASLGTTKYCSHFLKGTQCMKPDCMYLHDYGDEAASFTKEEIQQGKHLVYEQKLYDQFVNCVIPSSNSPDQLKSSKAKDASPPDSGQMSPVGPPALETVTVTTAAATVAPVASNSLPSSTFDDSSTGLPNGLGIPNGSSVPHLRHMSFGPPPLPSNLSLFSDDGFSSSRLLKPGVQQPVTDEHVVVQQSSDIADAVLTNHSDSWQTSLGITSNNNNATSITSTVDTSQDDDLGFDPWDESAKALADLIEKEKVVSSSPIYRPVQAPLQHILPPPTLTSNYSLGSSMNGVHGFPQSRLKLMPPGFSQNGFPPSLGNNMHQPVFPSFAALHHQQQAQHRSKMLGLMQQQQQQLDNSSSLCSGPGTTVGGSQSPGSGPQTPQHQPPMSRMPVPPSFQSGAVRSLFMNPTESLLPHSANSVFYHRPPANDSFMWRDWQEGLKALLPNVNISFGNPNHNSFAGNGRSLTQSNGFLPSQNASSSLHNSTQVPRDKSWCSRSVPDLSWDPAIINSGDVSSADNVNDDVQPHWMASLHHLTEDTAPHSNNHQSFGLGGVNSFNQSPGSSLSSWFPQHSSRIHPPGFGLASPTRPGLPSAAAEAQLFGEHQLSA